MGSSTILSPTKTSTRKSITLSATAGPPPVMSIKPQSSDSAGKATLSISNKAEEDDHFFVPYATEEERTRESSPSTSSSNTTTTSTASTVLSDDDYMPPTRRSSPASSLDDEPEALDVLTDEEAAELAAALERMYLREERERREKERGSLAFYRSLQAMKSYGDGKLEVEERWDMHEDLHMLGKVGLEAREARTFEGRLGRRVWRRRSVVVAMEEWDGD